MKAPYRFLLLLLLVIFTFQSCEDYDDTAVPSNLEVNDFIWKGLNLYYLWQADVPDLADKRFDSQKDLNTFLYGYSSPEKLFQDLLNKPVSKFPSPGAAIDRFSFMYSNYTELEGVLSGTTKNNGVEYKLFYKNKTENDVIGIVHYILPNSDASGKDIQRGAIFYAVNGTKLYRNRENPDNNNLNSLLSNSDSYTLNFADYDNGNYTPNGRSVSLTKTVLSENPVYISKIIESGNHKIGYLMYNGFYASYETQLNNAFGELKAGGITDFVLDLRYNSGGSIATATRLASMITGQFTGQVFAKQQWNDKVEAYYASNNPSSLLNLFTDKINTNASINSLNLTRIYILTSKSTASASELVINGLKPYINVIQIGDSTTGKNVGSITLYDSPNFTKKNVNPNHRYAMQPLVLKIVNKVGFGDYINGLTPNFEVIESINNLGILGDSEEPLLNIAINKIKGGGRKIPKKPAVILDNVIENQSINRLKNEMYIDELPDGL